MTRSTSDHRYRVRRCWSCHATCYAGELGLHPDDGGARWGWQAPARRVCPHCGHVGPLEHFPLQVDLRASASTPTAAAAEGSTWSRGERVGAAIREYLARISSGPAAQTSLWTVST